MAEIGGEGGVRTRAGLLTIGVVSFPFPLLVPLGDLASDAAGVLPVASGVVGNCGAGREVGTLEFLLEALEVSFCAALMLGD